MPLSTPRWKLPSRPRLAVPQSHDTSPRLHAGIDASRFAHIPSPPPTHASRGRIVGDIPSYKDRLSVGKRFGWTDGQARDRNTSRWSLDLCSPRSSAGEIYLRRGGFRGTLWRAGSLTCYWAISRRPDSPWSPTSTIGAPDRA